MISSIACAQFRYSPFPICNKHSILRASDYVVGVVLTQHAHSMSYHSETLSDIVWKYPTYDKEMYSIVKSCCQWKHYILWKETIIHTDYKPLQLIQTQGKLRTTAIRSGPPTCNSFISTSSIRQVSPIVLLIASVTSLWLHSPLCSIPMDMKPLSGPNFISKIWNSPPHKSSWVQLQLPLIFTFKMDSYAT
jgi:hypothetical protein